MSGWPALLGVGLGVPPASGCGRVALGEAPGWPVLLRSLEINVAFGWKYHPCTTRVALDQVLTAPTGGRQLIEVPLPLSDCRDPSEASLPWERWPA